MARIRDQANSFRLHPAASVVEPWLMRLASTKAAVRLKLFVVWRADRQSQCSTMMGKTHLVEIAERLCRAS